MSEAMSKETQNANGGVHRQDGHGTNELANAHHDDSDHGPAAKKVKSDAPVAEAIDPAATPKKGFNYHAYLAKKTAGPAAPGSKEIPGLTFVFTGELSSIGRDDASDLVKRYGGRVTGAPSGKTDYVVIGENAGAAKLEKIEKLSLKTLDEDGLLDLIRSRSTLESAAKPVAATSGAATPVATTPAAAKASSPKRTAAKGHPAVEKQSTAVQGSDLWTVRYAPKKPDELIGNHSIYEKMSSWLETWKSGPPSDFRAVLLSGPPGIGKTTMAHMVCRETSYDMVELNASDTRSKKTLHDEVREVINNSSLAGFFSAHKPTASTMRRQAIIMDECDGMSAGDRGGMAELIQLIKRTKVPIICICNDRASPKVRSLANYCLDLRLRRPDARQITPRLAEMCRREGLAVGVNTIEELVASTQADIRQIINLLSTYRLTQSNLTFDDSKRLAEGQKKDMEEGPFDAIHSLFAGPSNARMSLRQKMDLYFIDSGLMPLMVQENYIKCRASTPRTVHDVTYGATAASFATLTWAAADSISRADAVDSLIRGYNQEWSLAPLHAIYSTVSPAYYCHGNVGGRVDFASWLGQNSKQTKHVRISKELSQHLYLHTHANRQTLCLDYAPAMAAMIVSRLQTPDGIDRAIGFLDAYSITKEDVEPLLELVLDPSCNAAAYAKLPTTTKSAFTRKYNQGTHLLPYASGAAVPVRRVKTDIVEGGEDEGESQETETNTDTEEGDVTSLAKDKMIKFKGQGKGPATGKGRGAANGAKK